MKKFNVTRTLFSAAIAILFLACNTGKKQEAPSEEAAPGVYEAVFIDVNNTMIPDEIDRNVKKETKLLANVNLTQRDQFWGDTRNFYVHGMGSIQFDASGEYYIRLTSTGKVLFRINNKEIVKIEEASDKKVTSDSMFIDGGGTLIEFEYYPGEMGCERSFPLFFSFPNRLQQLFAIP